MTRNSSLVDCTVGRYSSIGRNTKINYSDIGSFCAISWDCTINATSHPVDRMTISAFPYVPSAGGFVSERNQHIDRATIGSDVWLGAQAIIMPGVRVGHGAIIGAGSIVTRDVKPYQIAVGSPARHIRWRFDAKKIESLLELKWWNWPEERIRANLAFFQVPRTDSILESVRID